MKQNSKLTLMLVALPLCFSYQLCSAQSNTSNSSQQASLVRPTELKAQAFSDAATLKVLPENLKIDVLSRKASWMEVKAQGTLGWVKMLSLRFDNKVTSSGGIGDAAKSLFDAAKTGGNSSVTTGAKGFDKDKFINPTPNPEAFAKMKQFTTPKTDASNFAKQEKLNEQQQTYLKAPGDKS
ncbi:hypothetical protein [Undibacterium flavidum]|uniref:SH3 domain-containing protein n=1 Tax=Undibacterium flavidum TaxID=2762297 RepID=A0ABR6YA83_9BURK|nr:hypothetical protein [Undibacterium flavidum]MBC3873467.1 hypothetical protein [Undibacterium flavidum]